MKHLRALKLAETPPAKAGTPNLRFGTDGWRAVIADDFTFANVARVAQAAAGYWLSHPAAGTEPRVVIGYDRRFLAGEFAACAAEVLAGNGFKVWLTPAPAPTPAVSFAVKQGRCVGGIMITASHNPAIFNGFKLKTHWGGPAGPEYCAAVEARLDRQPVRRTPFAEGRAAGLIRLQNVLPPYFRAIQRLVDFPLIARSRLRVAHDALFGTGAGCFDELLRGTTCRVTTLNGQADPLFGGINPEPIEPNYRLSQPWLRRHPHDICLVTDGDADRVGGMDGRGNYLSTHMIICLLLQHLVKNRQGRGRVVKALTTTSLLDKMCADYGLPLCVTPVGFKHTCAEMILGGVLLGGEESGGIGFAGHIPERDGLLAGLYLLEMLAMERKRLPALVAALERRYGPHRYARRDIPFPVEQRDELMAYCAAHPPARLLGSPVTDVATFDGVKYTAADTSWLMLRGSGTEPVVRIYAESSTEAKACQLLEIGLRITRKSPGWNQKV